MAEPHEWATIGVIRRPSEQTLMEARWAVDMPAYYRLRKEGLQPRGIDGCAELETRAHDREEIELGHVFPDREERARAIEGMRLAEEIRLGLV